MAESSRRAADRRAGRANARFVVASAEHPPTELIGRAGLVTVTFPWGSLLRGIAGQDAAALAGIVALLTPGATLEATLSIEQRDGAAAGTLDDEALDTLADAWRNAGLTMPTATRLEPEAIRAIPSSWARRLASDPERRVWRIQARRAG